MSKAPILPRGDNFQPESYEQRMRFNLERELQTLKGRVRLLYEQRVSGVYAATAPPTGGQWVQGDMVRNSAPVEAGVVLAKYVIVGWICVATGTPGTWLQMRTLTGN